MQVTEAVQQRRSARKFTSKPVQASIIREVFEIAQQAPSNCNTQPWQVTVVSGEKRDALEKALMAELMSGQPGGSVFTMGDAQLAGVYKERQVECAVNLWNSVGVERSDKAARQQLMARNWQFFGAPHVALIGMDKNMVEMNALDIGIYVQTLLLLFTERGIDCCPQGALALFPEPLYDVLGISRDVGVLCGISFGYAEREESINSFFMPRAELGDSVRFLE